MFKVIQASSAFTPQGFQMTFANGWMVSVMFGRGNYCMNKRNSDYTVPPNFCNDAEIAVFYQASRQPSDLQELLGDTFGGDGQIIGWANPDKLAEVIAKVQALEPIKSFVKPVFFS